MIFHDSKTISYPASSTYSHHKSKEKNLKENYSILVLSLPPLRLTVAQFIWNGRFCVRGGHCSALQDIVGLLAYAKTTGILGMRDHDYGRTRLLP